MSKESIFDVASITKAIPTASLTLQLIDQNRLALNDQVISYLPELRNPEREKLHIRHLLTYTLAHQGPGLSTFKSRTAEEMFEYAFTQPFASSPGTIFAYSNLPALFLGLLVERVLNNTLDHLAETHFFDPLKMISSTFQPKDPHTTVPTEIDDWRGLVQGVVHDESAYLVRKEANKVVGHAGLFSTAPDILNFLEMLLHKGELSGKRYFSEEMVEQMGTNQIPELGESTGLGWELNQPRFMGSQCGPHTFGKTGFTGTLCVCDVGRGIAFVILTNRAFPKRPTDASAGNAFRAAVADVVWGV